MVILLDKFGVLIHDISENLKKEEYIELNEKMNNYIEKLYKDTETETKKIIPGYIKFKIINLIEKKNRGWTETLVDKISKIKSIKQVKDDFNFRNFINKSFSPTSIFLFN